MKVQELTSSTGKLYLTISFDEANKWIYNDWIGYVTPDNVMQGCLAVLDEIKKHKVSCGLNDNRHLVGRWDQSVRWIDEEWTPLAVAAGLRYFAQVVDTESFAAASSVQMLERVQGNFTCAFFMTWKVPAIGSSRAGTMRPFNQLQLIS